MSQLFVGNNEITTVYPNTSTISVEGNVYADTYITVSSSSGINSVLYKLKIIRPGASTYEIRYWLVKAHRNGNIISSSIDITSNIRNNNGSTFILQFATSTKTITDPIENSSTPISASTSNVSSQYYFTAWYNSQYSGHFEVNLIYPSINDTPYFINPRKILFKITHTYSDYLTDISITFRSDNIIREYTLSNDPDMFELRIQSSNTWVDFDKSINMVDDINGVYAAFSISEHISSNVSNIQIEVSGTNSGSEFSGSGSFKNAYKDDEYTSLYVDQGDKVLATKRASLYTIVNKFNDGYRITYISFGLIPPSGMIVRQDNIIDIKTFSDQLQSFKNLYTKFSEIFPVTYPSNSILNNYTVPDSHDTDIIIEANRLDPSNSYRGNLFNNLIWIMKNLL